MSEQTDVSVADRTSQAVVMGALEQSFVDIVAREFMLYETARLVGITCGWCPSNFVDPGYHYCADPAEHRNPRRMDWQLDFTAAKLLGMLVQANGCELDVIVAAAASALRCGRCGDSGVDPRAIAGHAGDASCHAGECRNCPVPQPQPCTAPVHVEFDTAAFFRSVALEAIGAEGERWQRLGVPQADVLRCGRAGCNANPRADVHTQAECTAFKTGCCPARNPREHHPFEATRPFIVPRLAIEGGAK